MIFDEMIGKAVLLDNGKHYQVIWALDMESRKFLYLLNADDLSEPLFCEKLSEVCLEKINDKELLNKVILSINREIKTFIL